MTQRGNRGSWIREDSDEFPLTGRILVNPISLGAQKKPAVGLLGVDTRRAVTAGIEPNASCGVPVRPPSARQPHQTP